MTSPWFVYILLCRDGTLYTGITTDLARRLTVHNSIKGGARYTKSRQPVRMIYSEPAESRAMATRREGQIKRLSVAEKRELVGWDAVAPRGDDGECVGT